MRKTSVRRQPAPEFFLGRDPLYAGKYLSEVCWKDKSRDLEGDRKINSYTVVLRNELKFGRTEKKGDQKEGRLEKEASKKFLVMVLSQYSFNYSC